MRKVAIHSQFQGMGFGGQMSGFMKPKKLIFFTIHWFDL